MRKPTAPVVAKPAGLAGSRYFSAWTSRLTRSSRARCGEVAGLGQQLLPEAGVGLGMVTHSPKTRPFGANGVPLPSAISSATRSARQFDDERLGPRIERGEEAARPADAGVAHHRRPTDCRVVQQVVGQLVVQRRAASRPPSHAGGVKTPKRLPTGSNRYANTGPAAGSSSLPTILPPSRSAASQVAATLVTAM